MQRKAAEATQRMMEARKELADLEAQRAEEHGHELAATEKALGERKAEAEHRVASVNITREVLGRFKQPSASATQAATRLADVIASQRKNEE